MSRSRLANYEKPRALFREVVSGSHPRQILLLSGANGTGKTSLLRASMDSIPRDAKVVSINLANPEVSPVEVLFLLIEEIGPRHFKEFQLAVDRILGEPYRVRMDKNWIVGAHNKIHVSMSEMSERSWVHRVVQLTGAWMEEMATCEKRAVLVFDNYEAASPDMAAWISGSFLGRIRRAPHLRVVIAGQEVPDPQNIAWGDHAVHAELAGVPEPAAWLPLVQQIQGREVAEEDLSWLKAVCGALDGRPSEIVKILEALRPEHG